MRVGYDGLVQEKAIGFVRALNVHVLGWSMFCGLKMSTRTSWAECVLQASIVTGPRDH